MILHSRSRLLFFVAIFVFFTLVAVTRNTYATGPTADPAAQVAALKLGMNGYIIGAGLSAEQKEFSAARLLDDAFEGTYKFKDGEMVVVVAEKDDTVLALYQRNEDADIAQARKMVSTLMLSLIHI